MNVQTAEPRRVEHRARQDQPIGDDDAGIAAQRGEDILRGLVAQARRRCHVEAQPLGGVIHRGLPRLVAAPGGPGRLAVDAGDVVAGGVDGFERRHGERRRAHEDEAEDGHG